jgi:hypothetical protein
MILLVNHNGAAAWKYTRRHEGETPTVMSTYCQESYTLGYDMSDEFWLAEQEQVGNQSGPLLPLLYIK